MIADRTASLQRLYDIEPIQLVEVLLPATHGIEFEG